MPADIRSFFGGKSSTPVWEKETKVEDNLRTKRSKSRRVIKDSDDEESLAPKKATPAKPPKKPSKKESPKGQETTSSDYFASHSNLNSGKLKDTPTAKSNQSSPRKKKVTSHGELDNEQFGILDEEDVKDIYAAGRNTSGMRKNDEHIKILSEDELEARRKKTTTRNKSGPKKPIAEMKDKSDDYLLAMADNSDVKISDRPNQNSRSQKRKSRDPESDDEDDRDGMPSVKSIKLKSAKPPPAKKSRALSRNEAEDSSVQAILNSISTVRPPTPPPKDSDSKFNWRQATAGGGNVVAPPTAGSKDIPQGEENCLAGLSFVFTGLLETLSRDEGQALVKRYAGKVTGAPSKKTSFVVLGNDAGPSKLRKIQELNLKTINEDGLFELLRIMPANGGDGKAATQNMEKKKAEMEKTKQEAEAMDREEKRKFKEAEKEYERVAKLNGSSAPTVRKPIPASSQLWTTKYAPTSLTQICGNKSQVERIQSWLKGWPLAHKYKFQKKGPDGLGGYRAIIIHGPPGIGKTTAAHLAARLAGYDVLESNASDTRSKKLVESGLTEVLNNNSLLGYFAGDGKDVNKNKKKIVLIMDEVDGMSAGDRGGVGALAKVCKTTDIPMILICNERKLPKMKPFDFVTFDMSFRRPTVDQIRSRIATICHREGLKLPPNVMDALIEGSNKDIRQIINMISTAKLDQTSMDFDQGKSMSKAWEKHVVLKPWDICHRLLGDGMFSPKSKATLNDKIELYFNDHEFSYLMIQENYLSTKPSLLGDRSGKEARLKALQLADQAAESISDGDLVDRMIHGSQQQWSLMPTHAVFSTVIPASFVAGLMTGRTSFTMWLGNNSKHQKLARYVKEIQSHMRLRTSGDRHEIRQQYLPVLWAEIIQRMENEGKECVDEVIDLMDSYFLTREDFDYIMELGLGPQNMDNVKLESQTKATFTRLYNLQSHPLPFMKASHVVGPAKIIKEAPDLEEAIEEEDEGDLISEVKEDDEETDLKKDKYIRQPKKKQAAKKSSKKKAATNQDDDDIDLVVESKSKKMKAKPKSAPNGKLQK